MKKIINMTTQFIIHEIWALGHQRIRFYGTIINSSKTIDFSVSIWVNSEWKEVYDYKSSFKERSDVEKIINEHVQNMIMFIDGAE